MDLPYRALGRAQCRIHDVLIAICQLVADTLWATVLQAERCEWMIGLCCLLYALFHQPGKRLFPATLGLLLALQGTEHIPGQVT